MAIYYIDFTLGNDNNSGLSETLAWKTLSKVRGEQANFNPGDSILFKRGETWTCGDSDDWLRLSKSGSSGNPITYGAYGSGNLPIIDCNDIADYGIASWTDNISWLVFEDFEIRHAYWHGIAFNLPHSHITCKRCLVHESSSSGIVIGMGSYATLEDCDVDTPGLFGIIITGDPTYHQSHTLIHGCRVWSSEGDGITLHDDDYGNPIGDDHTIEYCVVWNCTYPSLSYRFLSGTGIVSRGNSSRDPSLPTTPLTYYVDATLGNDGNTGLSETQAWKTLTKVRSYQENLSSGDSVLFKCGETWVSGDADDTLRVLTSGEAGKPITYGAYGNGAKPVIDCNHVGATGILSWAGSIAYLVFKDIEIRHSVQQGAGFDLPHNHLNLRRILVHETDNNNGMIFSKGSYVTIEDCDIDSPGLGGIVIVGDAVVHQHDTIIKRCRIWDADSDGITLHTDDSQNDIGANHLIEGCTVWGCGEQAFDFISGTNILLKNCESYDNVTSGIIVGSDVGGSVSNVTIQGHYSHDEGTGIYLQYCSDIKIQYSILKNGSRNVRLDINVNNVNIYNNILYATLGGSYHIYEAWTATGTGRNIKNNIFIGDNVDHRYVYYWPGANPNNTNAVYDYNLYWRQTGGPDDDNWWLITDAPGSCGWTNWKALWNQDAHGMFCDPEVVNPGIDFHPKSGSPCIDAGIDVGLTEDKEGREVPQRLGVDIGVFEFPDCRTDDQYIETDFDRFMRNPNIKPIFLLEIKTKMRLLGFGLSNGQTYTYELLIPDRGIDFEKLWENGQEYSKKNSISEVEATASSFYFDFYGRMLYIHTSLGIAPLNYFIEGSFWLYFTNYQDGEIVFNDKYYFPFFKTENIPDISQEIKAYYEGSFTISSGTISLFNPKIGGEYFFDKKYDRYFWKNSFVQMKIGKPGFSYSQYKNFFSALIDSYELDDRKMTFNLVDSREAINVDLPFNKLWKKNYPMMAAELEGTVLPVLFGPVTNALLYCIDEVARKKFIFHDGPIKAVNAVKKNGIPLVEGTDYFANLRDSIIVFSNNITITEQDQVTIDFQGKTNLADELISNGADIYFYILKNFLGLTVPEIHVDSIEETKVAQSRTLSVYLYSEKSSGDIIRSIEHSVEACSFQDANGKIGLKTNSDTPDSGARYIMSHQVFDFRMKYDPASIYKKIQVYYGEDPLTQNFLVEERVSNQLWWKYKEKKSFEIYAYLILQSEAAELASNILKKLDKSYPNFVVPAILYGCQAGDLFYFSRDRYYNSDGFANNIVMRILGIKKLISSSRTEITAEVVE